MIERVRLGGVRGALPVVLALLVGCVQTGTQQSSAEATERASSPASGSASGAAPAAASAQNAAPAQSAATTQSAAPAQGAPAPQGAAASQNAAPGATSAAISRDGDRAHPGRAVYDLACAACHDNPQQTRSPAFESIKGMRYGTLEFALTEGKMKVQAASLTVAQRSALIDYLSGRGLVDDSWITKMMCPADRRTVDLHPTPTVAGFGFDKRNHRHLTRTQAGLSKADFRNLELAWALAVPRATTVRAQPAVVGSTLFMPLADHPRWSRWTSLGNPASSGSTAAMSP